MSWDLLLNAWGSAQKGITNVTVKTMVDIADSATSDKT